MTARRGTVPLSGKPPERRSAGPSKRSPVRRSGRTASARVNRVEPRTVFRLSVLFYLGVLAVVVVALIFLWLIAVATGAIHGIDHSIQRLFGYQSFTFVWPQVLLGVIVVGLVLVAIGSLMNVVAALIYNLVSSRFGGVAVVVEEEPRGR